MRTFAFYFLLCVPILAWAFIVLPNYLLVFANLPILIVSAIIAASPIIGGDVSLFGEATPIVLAGSIIALMPSTRERIKYLAVGLAAISYLLFIHLNIYFSTGPGVALISVNFEDAAARQKVILNLVSNIKVMAIVIAASIIGFKVKGQTQGGD